MDMRDKDAERKLWRATVVTVFFVVSELVAGYLIGSILIVSDALHMLSHAAGFIVSLICLYLARKKRNEYYTWGYLRTEIVGALCSMAIVWIITVIVIVEGVNKLILIVNNELDEPINGKYMFVIAVYAMICNVLIIKALSSGEDHGHGHGGHGHSHGLQFSTAPNAEEAHAHSHGSGEHHGHANDKNEHGHSHGPGGYNHGHLPDQIVNPSHYLSKPQALETPIYRGGKHKKQKTRPNQIQVSRINKSQRSKKESETFNTIDIESQKSDLPTPSIEEKLVDNPSASIIIELEGGKVEKESNNAVDVIVAKEENSQPSNHVNKQENLNIAAANAHIIGDLFQSVGVLIAGAIIWGFPGDQYPLLQIVDPVATLFFTFPVLYTTIGVTRACFNVLMEGVPPHIKLKNIEASLKEIEHVESVHNLHIWAVSTNMVCLLVHLSLSKQKKIHASEIRFIYLKAVHIARSFGIHEPTIQIDMDEEVHCDNPKSGDPNFFMHSSSS